MALQAEEGADTRECLAEPLDGCDRRDAAHHALAKARGLVRVLDAMVAPHRGVDLPGLGAGQLGPVREGRRVAASPVGHATAGTRLTVRRPPAAHVLIAERSRASLDTARP
jgi:hypothetical protein